MRRSAITAVLLTATALAAVPTRAGEVAATAQPNLETQFRDPPNAARPRVWWHWMNGNVTQDGIAKDMAWMKKVGIGGMQNFDANLQTPQAVDKRLVYMTPEWKDAFRFAATEADRLGLELAIAASPGWSETGGPWVPPADGLKKVVWSEMTLAGGKPFSGILPALPNSTGPFQSAKKAPSIDELMGGEKPPEQPNLSADVRLLAFPVDAVAAMPITSITGPDGKVVDATALFDGDLETVVTLPRTGTDPALTVTYANPVTLASASLYIPGAAQTFLGPNVGPRLEASADGKTWQMVAEIPATAVPTTIGFAPVTARQFRIVFGRAKGGGPQLGALAPGVDAGALGAGLSIPSALTIKVGDLRFSAEAKVDRFEAKAGFELEPDYYALSQGLAEARGTPLASVIDITDKMKADGQLEWTPPAGNWKVLRLGWSLLGTTNHPAPKEATGLEVDKFDSAAVKRYMDHYIGMYKDAAGADLVGKRGVRAILTDSIEVGAANWTPKMLERFKKLRGYDATPWLPALTGTIIGSRAESDKFLYDYRRTLADLMASDHYGAVAEVAHQNGLIVYGEALEDRRPSLGDDMSMRRYADVPMAAMWTHDRKAGPRPSYLADIKGAASVAHIYGQNLVAAESLTAFMSPWAFGPNDLKRVIDLEFVTGVNRPVIHTSVHQPVDDKVPGFSLWIFGQYFNRHEAWADLARPWVDYIARNSLMLQAGRHVADLGYVYGEEAPLTGLYGFKPIADAPKAHAYDFVSNDALMAALVNQGNELVAPGGARYRALYLGGSSTKMTLATLNKLAALVSKGATVIGLAPTADPSGMAKGQEAAWKQAVAMLWSDPVASKVGSGQIINTGDVNAGLKLIGVAPDFRFDGGSAAADIRFIHRQLADGDSYFINNRSETPEKITAHFRVTGKMPELWHAETGTSEPVSYSVINGETVIPLNLAGDDAVHVVFRKPASTTQWTAPAPAAGIAAELTGPWQVSFQASRGAPATTSMAKLAPLNENADAGIKYFSGIATYSQDFITPKGWSRGKPLWLDLGEAKEIAEVTVNGKVAGSAWHAPYRLNIGEYAKAGKNSLSIRVGNLWVNRMIGDAQPGATKITWNTGPGYRKDAPLRRSGLIGPVTIAP